MTNKDIVEQAAMLGLLPMAVRFHLEYTGALAMPRERKLFLQYVRGQRNRSQLRNISPASGPDINISQSSPSNQPMKYFPGIELKLGKERDSVIRPMVTSVFRAHRDEFRAALLEAGLKYGELRMWKDAQLCTAIHVADAFKPGLWNANVEYHYQCSAATTPRTSKHKHGLKPSDENENSDFEVREKYSGQDWPTRLVDELVIGITVIPVLSFYDNLR